MKAAKIKILKSELIYHVGFEKAPSCHASTLVKMSDGRLAAAWFAGTGESHPDVRIWFSVLNGDKWDVPRPLTPDDGVADWNPTLFRAENGRLILIYKSGLEPSKWHSMVITSDDCGGTWTEPRDLVAGDPLPRGPVKNKMVRLSNGRIIAPASDEIPDRRWGAFFDLSDDGGETWTRTRHLAVTFPGEDLVREFPDGIPLKVFGLIQPTVWEYPYGSGRLRMFARSGFGWIYRADSDDFGSTWSVARATTLPNNNSGIDAVMSPDGVLALVYNPVGKNWGPRYPIALALSSDNGESFCDYVELDTEEGEYSYPAIICEGRKLFITYTYKRASIKHVEAEIIL